LKLIPFDPLVANFADAVPASFETLECRVNLFEQLLEIPVIGD